MNEIGTIEVVQEVDAVPVLAPAPSRHEGLVRSISPASQALVLAASGFAAGAAVVGLAARRRTGVVSRVPAKRRSARGRRARKRGETVKIVGSRSLLVDVHLLGGAER